MLNARRLFNRTWLRVALAPLTTKQLSLFPILGAIRTFDRARFNRDGWAGLIIALLALPQGLAFAFIAGLPPHHGVYGTIAGLALGAMFSGSRHASFGPALTVAVLLMSTFVQLQVNPEERAEVVAILLVLSALMLVVGAWLRLAMLARFISRSVTIGFIVAAGFMVAASQLKYILGLNLPETGVVLENLRSTLGAVKDTRWPALLVGSLTAGVYLAIMLRSRRHFAPAAAVALLAGSCAAWLLEHGGFPVVRLEGLQRQLLPDAGGGLRLEWIGIVANTAFAAALLSHLEASLIGRSFAARAGERFDANQHMFGLGMANLGNAFFAGMPASVSLPRTLLAWRMRALTPIAGVLAALYCTALFLALAPWVRHVPVAALAALAMVMVSEIVSRHYLRVIMRAGGADAVVLLTTIGAGLLFRLDIALYLGAGLSIVFFLRRVGVPELSEYAFNAEGQLATVEGTPERKIPDISIVHVEGDLFFGAAEILQDQVRRICEDPNLQVIVLRMKNAHHLDATCALALEELLRFATDRGRHIIVCGAHREIYRVFRNSGLLSLLGRDNFFMDVPSNPTLSTRNALRRAQKLLGRRDANIRIYVDPARKAASTGTTPASV